MSSTKSDAPAAVFSYAQAAKGQPASGPSTKSASAPASGISTPAPAQSDAATSSNTSDDAHTATSPAQVADAERKQLGERTTSNSKLPEDASPSRVNDNTSDSVESSSDGDKTVKTDSSGQSTQATDADNDVETKEPAETKAIKPVYTEAKPPTVNIWAQRAAEQKAKVITPSVPGSNDNDSRRKSEPATVREHKKDMSAKANHVKPRRDETEGPKKSHIKRESDPPLGAGQVSWPKPTDAHVEDRKLSQDKDDKTAAINAKSHGKTEWTKMPYTPTAVFETRIEGRGAGRMGKGVGKNGQPASARGPPPAAALPAKGAEVNGRPNGRSPAAKSDREATSATQGKASPSLNASGHAQDEPLDSQTNGVLSSDSNGNIAQSEQATGETLRKNKPRRMSEGSVRQSGDAKTSGDASAEINGATEEHKTRKPGTPEKRADGQNADNGREGHGFREGKRGGRKGANRGAFNNGSFAGSNPYAGGFQEFQGNNFAGPNAPNFFPGRGNGGNRGYRNQGPRSQSIPLDPYARQMGGYGYPVLPPMQTYGPEFGYAGPYSAGPYPFQPPADLIPQALFQIEYYLSVDNLIKDLFLRKQMDSQGWVFLEVLAQFNRLKSLTTDQDVLKQACLMSTQVEIRVGDDGKDRVRKGYGWEQFVLAKEERDAAAQTDGPKSLRRPSPVRTQGFEQHPMSPQSADPSHGRHSFHMGDAQSAPFFPGAMDPRSGDFTPAFEEARGRPSKAAQQADDSDRVLTNGHTDATEGHSNGSITAEEKLSNGVTASSGN